MLVASGGIVSLGAAIMLKRTRVHEWFAKTGSTDCLLSRHSEPGLIATLKQVGVVDAGLHHRPSGLIGFSIQRD